MVYGEAIKGILNSCDSMDLAEAKALSNEMDALLCGFEGFGSPGYDKSAFEKLLERFESFENTVSSLEFMVFFYAYMGRIALHAFDLKKAAMYAMAGVEVCEAKNDHEGILAAKSVLRDIALSVGSTVWGANLFKQVHPDVTIPFEIEKDKVADSIVKKLF